MGIKQYVTHMSTCEYDVELIHYVTHSIYHCTPGWWHQELSSSLVLVGRGHYSHITIPQNVEEGLKID